MSDERKQYWFSLRRDLMEYLAEKAKRESRTPALQIEALIRDAQAADKAKDAA